MILGFILDLIIGDPQGWPHIVRFYGKVIEFFERLFYPMKNKHLGGLLLVLCTLCSAGTVFGTAVMLAKKSLIAMIIVDAVISWQCLAVKSLAAETDKVYEALESNDINKARKAVSMVVGRDTENLNEKDIARAAIETVAENTSDGICAPMFYLAIGGPVAGCLYKAVNTMDSMVGYRNEKYSRFGTAAARLDDILNYIPSRLTALSMIAASKVCGNSSKNALRIWLRDRRKHDSPNSAQTESVMAGALGIRLAGDAYYGGVLHKKEYIGDADREVENKDIRSAHKIMYAASGIFLILCEIIRGILYGSIRPWW